MAKTLHGGAVVIAETDKVCVGCGECCLKSPCYFTKKTPDGKCIELFFDDEKGQYRCKLASLPIMAEKLRIGFGCGARPMLAEEYKAMIEGGR